MTRGLWRSLKTILATAFLVFHDASTSVVGLQTCLRFSPSLRLSSSQLDMFHPPTTQVLSTNASKRSNSKSMRLNISLSSNHATFFGASMALVGSSLVGLQFDRIIPSTGILATLVTAAFLSNFGIAPPTHRLYDLCWTTFLPASLALLLLAYRSAESNGLQNSAGDGNTKPYEEPIANSIRTVSLPFVIASLGSLVGCLTSFLLFSKLPWLGLSLEDARVAAACLSASFVGGSVNFFATARLINASPTLLGSLATSDLIVMAIYFAFLTASLGSKYFRNLFSNQFSATTSYTNVPITSEPSFSKSQQLLTLSQSSAHKNQGLSKQSIFPRKSKAFVLIGSMAFGIVHFANRMEQLVGRWIPGAACAVIAVVAPLFNNYFSAKNSPLWMEMQTIASPLSDLCFHWLFASIGTSANIQQALLTGPACLIFSSLALALHIGITFVGCYHAKRRLSLTRMELEDVLIASNAAIGGPATAAAFCSRMHGPRLRGWTMAATVWGVVGYAIGTMIGVGMFQLVGGDL